MSKIRKALIDLEIGHLANKISKDEIVKARTTKYYKREGSPGNYKYYYTKEEYNKAKSGKTEKKEGEESNVFDRGDEVVVGKYKMTVSGYTDDGRLKVMNNQNEKFTLSKTQTESVEAQAHPKKDSKSLKDIAKNQSKKSLYDAVNNEYGTNFKSGDIDEFEDDEMRKTLDEDDIKSIVEAEKEDASLDFLNNYPDDAKSWKDATDEIKDIAHTARMAYNEMQLNVLEDNPKAIKSMDWRDFKTPSEWNKKGKEFIRKIFNKMNNTTKNYFLERINNRFSFKE